MATEPRSKKILVSTNHVQKDFFHGVISAQNILLIAVESFFFQTPEELYDNKEFLMKINKLRSEVGLPTLEDYVKNMQQYA
jgi:hypothetical protein